MIHRVDIGEKWSGVCDTSGMYSPACFPADLASWITRATYPGNQNWAQHGGTWFTPELRADAKQCLKDLLTTVAKVQEQFMARNILPKVEVMIKYSVLCSFAEMVAKGTHKNSLTVQRDVPAHVLPCVHINVWLELAQRSAFQGSLIDVHASMCMCSRT